MTLQSKLLSENQIITMLQENNSMAWEHLYNKHAPVMYGLICNLTEDKLLAEEILMHTFVSLKENQTLAKIKYALCPKLLRYTYAYTTAYLKQLGIHPKTLYSPKDSKVIHLLTTQCNSINEAASNLNHTIEETRKNLYTEFWKLRLQNNRVENIRNSDKSSIYPLHHSSIKPLY